MKLKVPLLFLATSIILLTILIFSMGCSHIYIADEPREERLFRVHDI
jgi:hypothetical protein